MCVCNGSSRPASVALCSKPLRPNNDDELIWEEGGCTHFAVTSHWLGCSLLPWLPCKFFPARHRWENRSACFILLITSNLNQDAPLLKCFWLWAAAENVPCFLHFSNDSQTAVVFKLILNWKLQIQFLVASMHFLQCNLCCFCLCIGFHLFTLIDRCWLVAPSSSLIWGKPWDYWTQPQGTQAATAVKPSISLAAKRKTSSWMYWVRNLLGQRQELHRRSSVQNCGLNWVKGLNHFNTWEQTLEESLSCASEDSVWSSLLHHTWMIYLCFLMTIRKRFTFFWCIF